MNRLDINTLIGVKFNRLTVLEDATLLFGRTTLLCQCNCGKKLKVALSYLKLGRPKSCGCLAIEILKSKDRRNSTSEVNKKHGLSKIAEYSAWCGAIYRCTNPEAKEYKRYGARGIRVSTEWLNSFETFLSDMGKKPSANLSLDRIDNNGNYCKENCRWATAKEQSANRRISVKK